MRGASRMRGLIVWGMLAVLGVVSVLTLPHDAALAQAVQLRNDNGDPDGYSGGIRICWVFGSVVRAADNQYPLRIQSVDFYLYNNFQNAATSAEVRAVVYALGENGQPNDLLASSPPTTITTFYPGWASIPITTPTYVTTPAAFLIGVQYESGTAGTIPSILSDSETNIPTGKNFYSQSCGASWMEHYDFWNSPSGVGYNIVRASVQTGVTPAPTWTLTPTLTPTPGPSPTLIPGHMTSGVMVGGAKMPMLARSPEGRVHYLYSVEPRRTVYHVWSDDEGQHWSTPLIAAQSQNVEVALASDAQGVLHLVYGPWDGHPVYYTQFVNGAWTAPIQIGVNAYGRNIAVDSLGRVHVVWSNADVWYTRRDPTGWTTSRRIAVGGWHPSIALGQDDSIHIAFNDNNYCCNDSVEVRYIVSTDRGASWSLPQRVSEDRVWSGGAALGVTPDGVVHLTYVTQSAVSEGGLVYRQRRAGVWSAPEVISMGNAGVPTGSTGRDSAAMAVDAANTLFVAFRCQNSARLWDVCLRVRDWQGWQSLMNLTSNTEPAVQSGVPGIVYGMLPATRGLDLAWLTYESLVYRYVPRAELGIRATPTPTPTSTATPGAVYARVVDETGQPVDGARVYVNGQLVSEPNGAPRLSRDGGVVNLTALQAGDSLAALALQTQRRTARQGHDDDPDPRYPGEAWAYRVYVTNVTLDDAGVPSAYQVPHLAQREHRLVVKRTNPLILFNLVVSLEWDMTENYLNELRQAFKAASDYLYDATDGQMALGRVTIYDRMRHWADADIQILTSNMVNPHAAIGGIDRANGTSVLRVGRLWNGNSGNVGSWGEDDGYRTLVHELGHYALYLYDEYIRYVYDEAENIIDAPSAFCPAPGPPPTVTFDTNASIMYNQYSSSEFSAQDVLGLWSAGCRLTQQWLRHRKSTWETIVQQYSDIQTPPRWSFVTPLERGQVMAGPQGLPSAFPAWPEIRVPFDPLPVASPIALTVMGPRGPESSAVVSLYKSGRLPIGQGLTDNAGRMAVYGAVAGDTVRAMSFDAGRDGEVIIGDAISVTLRVSPVRGVASQPGLIPYLRMIPEPGPGSGQVNLLIQAVGLAAESTPEMAATEPNSDRPQLLTVGYSPGAGVFEGRISLGVGQLGTGKVRVTQLLGGRALRLDTTYRLQHVINTDPSEVYSDDGALELHLEPGSLLSDEASMVVMAPGSIPGALPPDRLMPGFAYTLSASGSQIRLQKPALLTLHYDSAQVNARTGLVDLGIYRWDPNTTIWLEVPSKSNPDRQTVEAVVSTLGTYALLAKRSTSHLFLPWLERAGP